MSSAVPQGSAMTGISSGPPRRRRKARLSGPTEARVVSTGRTSPPAHNASMLAARSLAGAKFAGISASEPTPAISAATIASAALLP